MTGFLSPLVLLRRTWDAPLREVYVRVIAWQTAATLALTGALTLSSDELGDAPLWSIVLGSAYVAQWVVLALSHSFHEHLDVQIRTLGGIAQDAPPERPAKVRLHSGWIAWDLKNRWLVLVSLVLGEVLLSPLLLLGRPGQVLNGLGLGLWGFYWLMVLLAYTTGLSHKAPAVLVPRKPLVPRMLAWLTERVFGLRWWLPRLFARLSARFLAPVRGPSLWVEEMPASFAGLAVARLVLGVPFAWLWLRPFMAAASAQIISSDPLIVFQRSTRPAGHVDSRGATPI